MSELTPNYVLVVGGPRHGARVLVNEVDLGSVAFVEVGDDVLSVMQVMVGDDHGAMAMYVLTPRGRSPREVLADLIFWHPTPSELTALRASRGLDHGPASLTS